MDSHAATMTEAFTIAASFHVQHPSGARCYTHLPEEVYKFCPQREQDFKTGRTENGQDFRLAFDRARSYLSAMKPREYVLFSMSEKLRWGKPLGNRGMPSPSNTGMIPR